MRSVLVGVALLFLLSGAWRYRHAVNEWLTPPPPPKPILFDNGTVRQYAPPASQPGGKAVVAALPPGVLRKCVRGSETSYTNLSCPPGFREKPVDGSRVSVVPAGERAAVPAAAAPPGQARKTLNDALDLSKDEQLRQRIMDRAIAGERP